MIPWGAIIGGAATLGSAFLGAQSSAKGAEAANQANLASVKQQIDFQKWAMANRHQIEVADLRAAGLNPILSAGGQPPVPSGASTTFQNTKANRGELALATARALAETRLLNEKVNTEKTVQEANRAQAGGQINIGGVKFPISSVVRAYNSWTGNSAKSLDNSPKSVLRDVISALEKTPK